jgi:hypothetical protein
MSYTFSRTKMIEKIKFGLLSPDEIRKMSAARIITADTYDEDGLPILIQDCGRNPNSLRTYGSALRNYRAGTTLSNMWKPCK